MDYPTTDSDPREPGDPDLKEDLGSGAPNEPRGGDAREAREGSDEADEADEVGEVDEVDERDDSDDGVPEDRDDPDDEAVAGTSRRPPLNKVLLIGLLTAIVAIIVSLIAVVQISADRDDLAAEVEKISADRDNLVAEDRKQLEALTTGQEFLTAFFNFDGQTIDEDFDRILTFTTGEFDQQIDSFRDPVVRNGLRERQAQSRGEVVDLWVQSVDGERARLFAVVDNTFQNNMRPPVPDEIRMEIGLVREEGQWKVFDVGILPAAGSLGGGGLTPVPPDAEDTTETTDTTAAPAETTTTGPGG